MISRIKWVKEEIPYTNVAHMKSFHVESFINFDNITT
jgi:alpha-N-acetylglucosamine transferase